ncbi:acyl carrier protein [[Clostridium] polysaccharolyticum]|uniref:Acyl carrier protein n=1 Tax=[Clostridium] polysaccharolyticum TaxID=29364 RepID=A0A1H9ZNH9_9FIRM|nr:acyl carrier protein [[Clostridium] polysaccharolyticum]SES82735.1 hypothetical protein SAMN04487772_1043 [[Clostridium] polysaccharolyticum]
MKKDKDEKILGDNNLKEKGFLVMEKVKVCLLKKLNEMGIDSEFIDDMDVTTGELGLNSLDLVNLAATLFDEFGVRLRLLKRDDKKLKDICMEVAECCSL